jgi:FMN phosphatase YigB (HAD superfamily)
MNIDLDNIKVVIFDFDGTLAIYRDKNFLKHRNQSKD